MIDNFHKNKFYRVRKLTDKRGRITYKVEASESLFDVLFGMWKPYSQENGSLDEAIHQIEIIDRSRLESSKVVHSCKSKDL